MSNADGWVCWPGIGLAAPGRGSLTQHLAAEYGQPEPGLRGARLRLLASRQPASAPVWDIEGGHKGTRWHAVVGTPEADVVDAWVRVRGPFGPPLVQSQVVEPLLGAVIAHEDRALVPAAALRHDGRVELVVGDAGAGKTSLAMRALGSGWELLGDDRVFVGPGGVEGFARRQRVYPDARGTAPAFVRRLRPRDRRELRLWTAVAMMTCGFIRLPALVEPVVPPVAGLQPIHRATLLVRGAAPDGWRDDAASLAESLGLVVDRDRRALGRLVGPWPVALAQARELEQEALRRALEGRTVRLVSSPEGRAAAAVAGVAAAFGIRA